MLAEIQTDPDEVTAMEFNKEIPVMTFTQHGNVSICSNACNHWTPSTLKLVNAAYKKKLPIADSLSDTGRHG